MLEVGRIQKGKVYTARLAFRVTACAGPAKREAVGMKGSRIFEVNLGHERLSTKTPGSRFTLSTKEGALALGLFQQPPFLFASSVEAMTGPAGIPASTTEDLVGA